LISGLLFDPDEEFASCLVIKLGGNGAGVTHISKDFIGLLIKDLSHALQ
jgi:hypothetical protein